jgi:two-component system LytT family response regulator
MRLRSVIIDDEETGVETLKMIIEKNFSDVKVVACTTAPIEAIDLIEDYKPDIVFLDISMPEMDGFELLDKLNWKNFSLVFTTAHQEHALKAIKQNAVDYLLKPVDPDDLKIAIDKIRNELILKQEYASEVNNMPVNRIKLPAAQKLAVTSKHSVESIDPMEIISFESKSNYTLICFGDSGSILTPKILGEFEEQLCGKNHDFMRVHHSYIINLHKILRYMKDSDTIIMINNQKIPLSRSRREEFFSWIDSLNR